MTAEPAIMEWIGRTECRDDQITLYPARALAATLDSDFQPEIGDPLPPEWHWLYFLETPKQATVGPDGHAARGEFLPPIQLPRRMWGGNRLRFHAPLHIGDAARRVSSVESIERKNGRTGELAFVTVKHSYYVDQQLALEEWHDIVYRGPHDPNAAAPRAVEPPAEAEMCRELIPDSVFLFRYSALTFNGHKIHYDAPYVTDVEGYPGLIVHGPLTATLLMDLFRRERPDVDCREVVIRARRPLFAGNLLRLEGATKQDVTTVWALDPEGAVAMTADIRTR